MDLAYYGRHRTIYPTSSLLIPFKNLDTEIFLRYTITIYMNEFFHPRLRNTINGTVLIRRDWLANSKKIR